MTRQFGPCIAAAAVILGVNPTGPVAATAAHRSLDVRAAAVRTCPQHESPCFPMIPTIAFTSTRHDPTVPAGQALEIYLMDAEGTNVRRLTDNTDGEAFAALSPDGKGRIVFDSNRARLPGEPGNTSDLFIMNRFG